MAAALVWPAVRPVVIGYGAKYVDRAARLDRSADLTRVLREPFAQTLGVFLACSRHHAAALQLTFDGSRRPTRAARLECKYPFVHISPLAWYAAAAGPRGCVVAVAEADQAFKRLIERLA